MILVYHSVPYMSEKFVITNLHYNVDYTKAQTENSSVSPTLLERKTFSQSDSCWRRGATCRMRGGARCSFTATLAVFFFFGEAACETTKKKTPKRRKSTLTLYDI